MAHSQSGHNQWKWVRSSYQTWLECDDLDPSSGWTHAISSNISSMMSEAVLMPMSMMSPASLPSYWVCQHYYYQLIKDHFSLMTSICALIHIITNTSSTLMLADQSTGATSVDTDHCSLLPYYLQWSSCCSGRRNKVVWSRVWWTRTKHFKYEE